MTAALERHTADLRACHRCPDMIGPPVACGPVSSRVMLVGQAPGAREPVLQRPFAWTAGKTLFRWFQDSCGVDEDTFRQRVYISATCRCFPGKHPKGSGDRVPDEVEISRCARWLDAEFRILRPKLVIPVGKLSISQFLKFQKLADVIGTSHQTIRCGVKFDLIPLPHPSGASTWFRTSPGQELTASALRLITSHPTFHREVITLPN